MDHGRILYFGAPCGFGKTTVAFELLRGKKFELINGLESDGMLPEIKLNQNIVVIDDLQEFQEDEDLQKLNEFVYGRHDTSVEQVDHPVGEARIVL